MEVAIEIEVEGWLTQEEGGNWVERRESVGRVAETLTDLCVVVFVLVFVVASLLQCVEEKR